MWISKVEFKFDSLKMKCNIVGIDIDPAVDQKKEIYIGDLSKKTGVLKIKKKLIKIFTVIYLT